MGNVREHNHNDSQASTAYRVIRRAIVASELEPGEQVSEAQLAARFGFGRAAVRAALTRLAHDRLVEAIPRHGYKVAPITFKHVHDLFGLRLIVEPAAVRLVAGRADQQVIAELERLNQECRCAVDDGDMEAQRQANKAFHVAVARASGNELLEETVGSLLDQLERVLYLPQLAHVEERIEATFQEHALIIAALRARDARGAEQSMHDHLFPNQQFLIEVLLSSPQLRAINLVTAGRGEALRPSLPTYSGNDAPLP